MLAVCQARCDSEVPHHTACIKAAHLKAILCKRIFGWTSLGGTTQLATIRQQRVKFFPWNQKCLTLSAASIFNILHMVRGWGT